MTEERDVLAAAASDGLSVPFAQTVAESLDALAEAAGGWPQGNKYEVHAALGRNALTALEAGLAETRLERAALQQRIDSMLADPRDQIVDSVGRSITRECRSAHNTECWGYNAARLARKDTEAAEAELIETRKEQEWWEVTARAAEAEVTRLTELLGPDYHIFDCSEGAWAIQHPMACRETGMLDCEITRLSTILDGPPVSPGRYRVEVTASGGLSFEPLARKEQP